MMHIDVHRRGCGCAPLSTYLLGSLVPVDPFPLVEKLYGPRIELSPPTVSVEKSMQLLVGSYHERHLPLILPRIETT